MVVLMLLTGLGSECRDNKRICVAQFLFLFLRYDIAVAMDVRLYWLGVKVVVL